MTPEQKLALIFGGTVLCTLFIWALGWMLLCDWMARRISAYRIRRAQRMIVHIDNYIRRAR